MHRVHAQCSVSRRFRSTEDALAKLLRNPEERLWNQTDLVDWHGGPGVVPRLMQGARLPVPRHTAPYMYYKYDTAQGDAGPVALYGCPAACCLRKFWNVLRAFRCRKGRDPLVTGWMRSVKSSLPPGVCPCVTCSQRQWIRRVRKQERGASVPRIPERQSARTLL